MSPEFRFTLDIYATASKVSLGVKKGETGRRLRIHLTEAGYPYHIPDNCYAVFAATKPDGKKIFNDCVIDDCEIIYDMTEQTVAAAGLMVCAINLYGVENDLLISASFSIIVYCPPVDQGDLESTSEYKALAALIAEAEALKEGMEEGGGPGGYYVPVVDQPTENTLQFSWMASGEGLPAVPPAVVELPGGGNDSGQNVDLSGYEKKAPEIVGTSVGEKAMEFSALMHGTDKVESFIHFADPHFLNSIDNEAQMRDYLETLKLYHDVTPTSFVACNGDWYGNSDTYATACFKLGYIDGWMRRLFGDRYYPAVGNHDTNQQGRDETGGTWTGILPKETVRNLWFRERGNTYYSFDGANTKFYVLDTWKEGTDAAYYWEQIAWLGEKLKTDNAENVALILHIGYSVSGDSYAMNTLATNALKLCEAFNNAGPITLNGVTYDFAGCTGKVRFAMCGHIHADYATIVNGIPLIATTHMRDGNTPTFDMCQADYGSNKLHLVRVGTGESRLFSMGPNGAILDGTGGEVPDDPPENTGLPVTFTVADPVVFLNHCNHNGGGINYYDKTVRALIATTENTGSTFAVGTGTTDTTHYALVLPDGATAITVNCGSDLMWAMDEVNATGNKIVDVTGRWVENGETVELTSMIGTYYLIKLKKADDSAFAADYDASRITWTFA